MRRNELHRAALQIPDQESFYGSPHFLLISIEETKEGAPEARSIAYENSLSFHPKWMAFSLLCDRHAPDTIDGTLRVAGKRILPERYLKLWRDAIDAPMSIADFVAEHGLLPVARFDGPLAGHRGAEAGYKYNAFPTFDAFESHYRGQMEVYGADDERFRLDLDLSQPDAAAHALAIASFLGRYDRPKEQPYEMRVELIAATVVGSDSPELPSRATVAGDLFDLVLQD